MAVFYASANGDIIGHQDTMAFEKTHPTPPAGTNYTQHFDETANPGIIPAFGANPQSFRMDGGTLTQNGTPVSLQPDGIAYRAFLDLPAFLDQLENGTDPLSRQEQAGAFRLLFRIVGWPV